MSNPGLYVHVPFCGKKCGYCSFITDVPRQGEQAGFLDAIEREADWWGGRLKQPIATVFLGGGTPSLLGPAGLNRLMTAMRAAFQIEASAELTSEMNPESATEAVLMAAREAGLNRVSLGVQSFHDNVLRALGRLHDAEGAVRAVRRVREAGYDNLSIDLMFGTPGQSHAMWREDLARAADLGTEHISLYGLTVDAGTPLETVVAAGTVTVAADELSAEMYETAIDTLTAAGFEHYEISNFARPGRRARHNVNYWLHGEYLGLGPAAHSHYNNERWRNTNRLDEYLNTWRDGAVPEAPREEIEAITPRRRLSDTAILGLRMMDGVDWPLKRSSWSDISDLSDLQNATAPHLAAGLLLHEGGRLRLSRRGLLLSNEVFADLLLDEK